MLQACLAYAVLSCISVLSTHRSHAQRELSMRHFPVLLILCILLLPACSTKSFSSGSLAAISRNTDSITQHFDQMDASQPEVLDSDADGVPDIEDRCPRTPQGLSVDTAGCPQPDTKHVVLGFGYNRDVLGEAAEQELQCVGELLAANPSLGVLVHGHTDSTGSAEYNQLLSESRAKAVADQLTADFNLDANRIRSRGMGEFDPMADNTTEQGREQNRRVEIIIVDLSMGYSLAMDSGLTPVPGEESAPSPSEPSPSEAVEITPSEASLDQSPALPASLAGDHNQAAQHRSKRAAAAQSHSHETLNSSADVLTYPLEDNGAEAHSPDGTPGLFPSDDMSQGFLILKQSGPEQALASGDRS
ncbi:MAG: OmpA family protein [Desulfovibrio sp.]|nr:MAG: OmpA family protein [Desulfovibrio sp.]